MMKPEKHSDETWDKLFKLFEPELPSSDEAIDAELRALGLDTSKALKSIKEAIAQAQARDELDAAAERFAALTANLPTPMPAEGETRESIRQKIQKCVESTGQAAFFKKLDDAASDEDLQSLLADLKLLETMSGGSNDTHRRGGG